MLTHRYITRHIGLIAHVCQFEETALTSEVKGLLTADDGKLQR